MIKHISHLTILVKNQDEALAFYTNKLGFKKHTDAQFEGMRWLTVCPAHNEHLEFALTLPEHTDDYEIIGRQAGCGVLAALETSDCKKDFQLLSDRGVEFVIKPEQQPWGIQAVFKDLYGNMFNLVQPLE